MYETTKHRYILNLLALGLMDSEKNIFLIFCYIALYKHMTPWVVTSLEPRGFVSRIYVGDHLTLLYTKYISCGPQGFREEDFFKVFPL